MEEGRCSRMLSLPWTQPVHFSEPGWRTSLSASLFFSVNPFRTILFK